MENEPKVKMVNRFVRHTYTADCVYDIIYTDRKTGHQVLNYDGADPANTREDYGASSDEDCLANMGYDIREMMKESDCVCAHPPDEDERDWYDDYEDDY